MASWAFYAKGYETTSPAVLSDRWRSTPEERTGLGEPTIRYLSSWFYFSDESENNFAKKDR